MCTPIFPIWLKRNKFLTKGTHRKCRCPIQPLSQATPLSPIAQFISASQHSAVVENDKVINNFVNVYGAQSPITIPVTRFWTRETSVANNNNNQAQQSLSYRLVSKVDFHGCSSQFASSSKRRNYRCELFVMKLVHL